ncbi:phosphoglycerate mutase-like protein [Hygrophoropsis aurantiaca]|uniref:Phosphoglycerate mutase-like protein n=1 Tax=Hygrophoropsis aurantiaca TaxID=72124 RepID=A0ACB8A0R5_9AGAM|nr:phosphoglycerate mutase-like protein [Hygrophoropsis aurantiaca]
MYIQALINLLPITVGVLRQDEAPSDTLRLGPLTPYKKAPSVQGIADLPSDCSVDRVMLMHRHGSRGPIRELPLIQGLAKKIAKAHDAIANATLPDNLQFLKQGYATDLQVGRLTSVGRRQLFEHGVNFLFRYPHLHADAFVAGNEERVIESSHWFGQGYLGTKAADSAFTTLPDTGNNWLRPSIGCPAWNDNHKLATAQRDAWSGRYIPPITRRLNGLLPGVRLSDDDTRGALYACAYDMASYDASPWCEVFLPAELASFEYEADLAMDGAFGYTIEPAVLGPMLGALYVNKLIERFQDTAGDAKPMYLEFGHDTTIIFALAALGLAKDDPPLGPGGMDPRRKFRTSDQVPFAANMVWERITCGTSFSGPQIRLVLNERTFPLDVCAKTEEDEVYGTCSLENFVAANKFSTGIEYDDRFWKDTCKATGARDVLVDQSRF